MNAQTAQRTLLPMCVIILVRHKTSLLEEVAASVRLASSIIIADNNSGLDFSTLRLPPQTRIVNRSAEINNFAAVRQELMSLSQEPWVFFVDSDEVVSLNDTTKLTEQLADPYLHGLIITRSDVFAGRTLSYGEAGNQHLVRLIRPEHCQWHNTVHEVAQVEGRVELSPITISHFAHDSISQFISAISRYARLRAASKTSTPLKNLFELCTFPLAKLWYILIIQGGVLDGWRGFVYASVMSLHSLLVRIYWYEHFQKMAKSKSK